MILYMLTLTDTNLSYEEHSEDFFIGIFSTQDEAVRIAEDYLQNVEGFNQYPMSYRVEKVQVFEEVSEIPQTVYMIWGWDTNEVNDEINIINSQCFICKRKAQQELTDLMQTLPKQEWTLVGYRVGETLWTDGFVRA